MLTRKGCTMKVFITGVAGFLGSHLADRLIDKGHTVCGVDNLTGGNLDNVNPAVEFHNVDCSDLNAIRQYMQGSDVVFHAACAAHEGLSVFSPYYITKNTFQNSISVISAAVELGVKKFVYCSSMSRYGMQSKLPYTEDMICHPQVPYGIAKYAVEQVLASLASLNHMIYTIVVPHNIIGPRQNYTDPYRNVAAIMINRMLQGKQPIIYGDGNQKRCFSVIDDVIVCIENVIENNFDGEVINIGPDEEYISINQLAACIGKELNFEVCPIYVNDRPLELKFAYCSSDKARRLLGYRTQTSLQEGLKAMVEYIQKRGPQPFEYSRYPLEIIRQNTPKTWASHLI